MFDKKEYNKKWNTEHRNTVKAYGKKWRVEHKEEIKEYRNKHKDKAKTYAKGYYRKHKTEIVSRTKEWKKSNPSIHQKLLRKYTKQYRIKYPERAKAHNYANNHYQRGDFCINCGANHNLNFHHTDYEKCEGVTLCIRCHKDIHKKR